jgi:hypothetical protein
MCGYVLWPVTVAGGVFVVGRRVVRREPLVTRSDGRWLATYSVRAIQGTLALWIFVALLIAIISIFTPVPDI